MLCDPLSAIRLSLGRLGRVVGVHFFVFGKGWKGQSCACLCSLLGLLFFLSRTSISPRVKLRAGRWRLYLHVFLNELFSSVRECHHSVWNGEKHNFRPVLSVASEVIPVHEPKRLLHNHVHCNGELLHILCSRGRSLPSGRRRLLPRSRTVLLPSCRGGDGLWHGGRPREREMGCYHCRTFLFFSYHRPNSSSSSSHTSTPRPSEST